MAVGVGFERVLDAARFLSRLPLPEPVRPPPPLHTSLRAAPAAGVLIAALPALVLVVASRLALPSSVAATLAIATLVAATGGLHEDGLADVADGFGGGATMARKLAIMRDSRIGTYGALAIGLALLLRIGALQAITERSGAAAGALAMLGGAAWSRGLMLLPLTLLRPARPDGLGHAAAAGTAPSLGPVLTGAALLGGLLPLLGGIEATPVLSGLLGGAAAALGVTRLARHQIDGVSGDVIGAGQQAAEVSYLVALCAAVGLR